MGKYDVIVVGAGHAGCEAALAAARLGNRTLLFSINLEAIAMMPCNPSIGGTGKGHLVREIDALGGEMGKNIDKTFIQSRMLNTAKGPAVHSLRAQADKDKYHLEMKKTIEKQPNLDMKQAEVVELLVEEGQVCGIVTKNHTLYRAKAVILATGTFLRGKIFIGDSCYSSGPNGLASDAGSSSVPSSCSSFPWPVTTARFAGAYQTRHLPPAVFFSPPLSLTAVPVSSPVSLFSGAVASSDT